ncbi:coiled-coil domain-containing glutamate-rich protein 1 [Osmerus eperlanus]|uniref:coiled-coil domain-containing glutamate-rich protein 1 n=1 Tax=Osmerus eperlanus TaxID=29151 RepID=UPI002E0F73D0
MLFEEDMCGKGLCQWPVYNNGPAVLKDQLKDDLKRDSNRWYKCGRRQGYRGKRGRISGHPQFQRKKRPRPSGLVMSLRPVNIKGRRAPGMRAPRNTNQFLMHEKYQMMHMRSDSIGTDSGSDCEMDFTDMDSYLGVLENARGALLDSPDLFPQDPIRFFPRQMAKRQQFPFFTFGELYQEESMQYFPSEDDVIQSEDFMQKDFIDFCDTFRGTEHVA